MFGFKKQKEETKPNTTTLTKYHIYFKTIDGENHLFTGMSYVDPNAIRGHIEDEYLRGENFLKDDEGIRYPINNIISIEFKEVEQLNNVIMIVDDFGYGIKQLYYPKKMIKILEE
jgi:hypothetical protein